MGNPFAGTLAHLRNPAEAGCQRDASDRLTMSAPSDAQRKANLRTAWVLAAVAALFGLGFFVRIVLFGG